MSEYDNQDANLDSEVSSTPEAPVESESQQDGEVESQAAEEAAETPKEESVPFHEHPRFKEVINDRNELRRELQALREQTERLAAPAPKKEGDPLIDRLKGIDPEFGQSYEKLSGLRAELEELRQWRQTQEAENIRRQAMDSISKLHTENKVPEELQAAYQSEIEAAARNNPQMGIKDIPEVYKTIHAKYSKLLDSVRREATKKYVVDKKADATPSPKRGGLKPGKEPKKPEAVDREEMLAEIARGAAKAYRSDSDL